MTGKKILIIEDNPLNLELVTDLLEVNGFLVTSASTAEEGLRLARAQSPDLVLMDFSLPGMDGLSATKYLKADPTTRDLKVVGLSANAMKGDEEAALRAGCDGYLTKPINSRTFTATVSQFIAAAALSTTPQTTK
jgi:CheY-like chemotaxis protein